VIDTTETFSVSISYLMSQEKDIAALPTVRNLFDREYQYIAFFMVIGSWRI